MVSANLAGGPNIDIDIGQLNAEGTITVIYNNVDIPTDAAPSDVPSTESIIESAFSVHTKD